MNLSKSRKKTNEHFQVGVTVIENIVDHLDRSRVTVLVLSPSYVRDSWCTFELHLAKTRMIEDDLDSAVVIVKGGGGSCAEKNKTLDYVMQVWKCLRWPHSDSEGEEGAHEIRTFYSRLKKSIGTSEAHHKYGVQVSIEC